jgi:hypothetical protein
MQITNELAKYQVVPLTFAQANVVKNQTDVQLKDASGQVDGLSMPFSGSIIGMAIDLSAGLTAGELTVGATINGTELAGTTQTITTAAAVIKKFPRNDFKFTAGQKLGVEITTNSAIDPETADLAVALFVALNIEGV